MLTPQANLSRGLGMSQASTPPHKRHRYWVPWAWSLFWAVFIALVGLALVLDKHALNPAAMVTAVVFFLLTLPYQLYSYSSLARDVRGWLVTDARRVFLFPLGIVAAYLVYAITSQCFDWSAFARLLAFVMVPTCLVFSARYQSKVVWQDLLAVFCLWVPFDTGLLDRIWAWPAGEGAYVINTSLAISLGVSLFVAFRGYRDVRFRFVWCVDDLLLVVKMLGVFTIVALPIGLWTGFLTINPQLDLLKALAAPLGIFFFIAVPEEFLFRGLVQTMLGRLVHRPIGVLIVTSVFFGATHLNNPPLYDWRFMLLATIAGIVYGHTFNKARSLLAPCLLHAAVDVIWALFLHT